jgi:thiamine biosynthesis lipoprotein
MGSRWSTLFFTAPGFDPAPVQAALQAAVDEVDDQMSTWKPDSDLMRLNASPVGEWIALPAQLMEVLDLGLRIGRASGGAFDIGMGDAVAAWGFGPDPTDPGRMRTALHATRSPAHQALELDPVAGRARRTAPLSLDLNGIAKGYGVDRLAKALRAFGITSALVGIDGEMRALGLRPDDRPWAIAIEEPDPNRRAARALLALQDTAVATSGDYRHCVEVQGRRLSHTMDPRRGAPLAAPPASVSVVARTCAEADAWATALMVLGPETGAQLAGRIGLDALFLLRTDDKGILEKGVGSLFSGEPSATTSVEEMSRSDLGARERAFQKLGR